MFYGSADPVCKDISSGSDMTWSYANEQQELPPLGLDVKKKWVPEVSKVMTPFVKQHC
jgi:hypothetical protein